MPKIDLIALEFSKLILWPEANACSAKEEMVTFLPLNLFLMLFLFENTILFVPQKVFLLNNLLFLQKKGLNFI